MNHVDATAPAGEDEQVRSRRGRFGLSIQSKLLIMLLAVSLASSMVVGAIGFVNGRQSLHDAAVDQLTAIREMRADAVRQAVDVLKSDVGFDAKTPGVVEMSREFNAAYEELSEEVTITQADRDRVAAYFDEKFIPVIKEGTGQTYTGAMLVPDSDVGVYLHLKYILDEDTPWEPGFPNAQAADFGDGSRYAAAAGTYNGYFERYMDGLDVEEVSLINADGIVVYDGMKTLTLGADLNSGPFEHSGLADGYRQLVKAGSLDAVVLVDYTGNLAAAGWQTMIALALIGTETEITGALALEIPSEAINAVTTGDSQWESQGLGTTGEVYLVGRDGLMRSTSRQLVEDPEVYQQKVIANGVSPQVAERIVETGQPVMRQPISSPAVERAMSGETGVITNRDYLGGESLSAYAPLGIDGLDWAIIARIDTSEAFAPVADFTRTVLLSLLGILIAVSVLSLLLAQVFTRPIHRLVGAVRRIAGGDLEVQVPQGSRDEFGDLGIAFNDMAASLRIKQELIDDQRGELDRLLHTLMPGSVVTKYRQGEETITEAHDNVSVVFAELVGFDDYARGLSAEQETAHLNTLMRGFDEAAERCGVETVRTLHDGYLASSGLVLPRVDNVRRAVEFARRLGDVIERFNAQHSATIGLRAGVDTGSVTSGLIARTSLAYDLWGDAVSLAYRVRSVTGEPGVFVSANVYERTREIVDYVEAGTIDTRGKTQIVWKVSA